MPQPLAYYLSPPRPRRVAAPVAALATLAAGLATLLLPAGHESASLWTQLAQLFPESARSCFALACASLTGTLAYLTADAVASRRALRPALTAALTAGLLSPAVLAVPLWPGLLAAAGLLALPAPVRRRAANDNPIPAHSLSHPFSLAA